MSPRPPIDALLLLEARDSLLALARSLVGDEHRAEDLVSETWVRALEHPPRERASLRAWLARVLRNRAADVARHEGRRSEREERAARAEAVDVEGVLALEGELVDALRGLCEPYRTTIYLRYYEDLGPHEIAARSGEPVATVKTRLRRGLELLREDLDRRHGGARATWCVPLAVAVGRRSTASAATAASGGGAIVAKALLAASVVLGGVVAWRAIDEPASVPHRDPGVEPAVAAPTSVPAAGRVAAPTTPTAPRRTPVAAAGAGPSEPARIRGTVRFDDERPAIGASVFVGGTDDSTHEQDELVRMTVGADGAFELAFDPLGTSDFWVRAELDGYVGQDAFWEALAPGDVREIDLVLYPEAVLSVRVVDPDGMSLARFGWRVDATQGRHTSDGLWPIQRRVELDAEHDVARFEGLMSGAVSISAVSALGVGMDSGADIDAARETTVDAVCPSPDLSRRIAVVTRTSVVRGFSPAAGTVHLVGGGTTRTNDSPGMGSWGYFYFDDLDAGSYSVEVRDPRFVTWTRSGVEPGHRIEVELVGSAGVHLDVGASEYGVAVTYPGERWAYERRTLLERGDPPPADGVFAGLVPGDVLFHVTLADDVERTFEVFGLTAGEVRDVVALPQRLAGLVLTADGNPDDGVAVQLTAGERAGHTLPQIASFKGEVVPRVDRTATTDESGHFAFDDIGPGTWTVRVKWSEWLFHDRTVELGVDQRDLAFERPPDGSLNGTVTLPDGVSHEGLVVRVRYPELETLYPFERGRIDLDPSRGAVDADGSFHLDTLPLGEGVTKLVILGPNSSTIELGAVHVTADGTEAAFDVRDVFPGALRVSAYVDGELATSGTIVVIRRTPWLAQHVMLRASGLTFIPRLLPVSREIQVEDAGRTWAYLDPRVVHVVAGATVDVDVHVTLTERTVLVLDAATDAPLVDADVVWTTALDGEPLDATGTTDAQGRLQLALPIGEVAFRRSGTDVQTVVSWGAEGEVVLRLAE